MATAAWPGPPARKNTGSGAAPPLPVACSQAMLSATLRPSGLARSSGTSKVVHCASRLSRLIGEDRLQGLNASVPSVAGLAGVTSTGASVAVGLASSFGLSAL